MNTVAIVQARMGSTRLPGKIMRKIGTKPLFKIVYDRITKANTVNDIVFATTQNHLDDPFCNELEDLKIKYVRGSEQNVLSRYFQAAREFDADVIVRVTCDDPFKDPDIIDRCVGPLLSNGNDFSSNIISKSFAEGIDVECFSYALLEKMQLLCTSPMQLEHVTPYCYENLASLSYFSLKDSDDFSEYRLTLDDPFDLEILTQIYAEFDFDYAITYDQLKDVITTKKFRSKLIGRVPPYVGLHAREGEKNAPNK